MIVLIELNNLVTNPPTVLNTYPLNMSRVSITPTILGTNARVCSLICVVAWKIETVRPIVIAAISIGAAEITTVKIASRNMVVTSLGVIMVFDYHFL